MVKEEEVHLTQWDKHSTICGLEYIYYRPSIGRVIICPINNGVSSITCKNCMETEEYKTAIYRLEFGYDGNVQKYCDSWRETKKR